MDIDDPARAPIMIIDQFLHPDVFARVPSELTALKKWRPEVDFPGATPVGETCELPPDSETHCAIAHELRKLFSAAWTTDRFYVNRFKAGEVPRFHADGEVLTCLLYPDAQAWEPNDHGETQLLIGGEIRGVLPIPNRMFVFDGRLLHRATSFRGRVRHTIAAKLKGVSFADIVVPS